MREAKENKHTVHFGSLMALCHQEHSELAEALRRYRGRVVSRGDNVRDEEGFYAVFSEQGTSASHLASATFLDAIARMPGNDGEDSGAIGAYTQCELEGPPTWITLPSDQRPASWAQFKNPVCRLRLNLYGHPLAGLYRERHCAKALMNLGVVKVKSWECLYAHYSEKLCVSIYVDDFLMVGPKHNLKNM